MGVGAQAAIDADRVAGQILAGFGVVIAIEATVQPAFRALPLAGPTQ